MTDPANDNVKKFYPRDAAKDPDNVLEQAMGVYSEVLVLGWDKEGRMAARASLGFRDGAEMLWVLELFKNNLITGVYHVPDDEEDDA